MGAFDQATVGSGLARPGMDTRQWTSFGTVDRETTEQKSTIFKDPTTGTLLKTPRVLVTLQPSNIPVTCRVASHVAGNGEGEWFPFLEGDEVIVAIPEGSERSGPVIIGRLNNDIDEWPNLVAGQDATKNTFGFTRSRAPFIREVASSYMVRQATTGANITIDQGGQVFVTGVDGHQLLLTADFLSLKSADNKLLIQFDIDGSDILLQADTTQLLLGHDVQALMQGAFKVGTLGMGPTGHAITIEQVTGLIANLLVILNSAGAFQIAFSATFAVAFAGYVSALLAAASSPIPLTPATPGGDYTALGFQAIINAALAAQGTDPQGVASGVAQFKPGVGKAGVQL